MDAKKSMSERDIITKYILPAIEKSGWNKQTQIREEVTFTAGRIFVKGRQTKRGEKKRAENVRKRNYWTKYGDKARAVLDVLLDKYAQTGIEEIEDMKVLTVDPIK